MVPVVSIKETHSLISLRDTLALLQVVLRNEFWRLNRKPPKSRRE